ncbi:DsbA family protein [Nocardioides rubriscoriae]|uniref:DsbA family protein n=1 Tax=Nocardioides rubriscoriae TaxID=642762 RepID=UPI0011DF43FC|nr:thioredoxin domain-containing protein [Nocardioides rubriscoriae]
MAGRSRAETRATQRAERLAELKKQARARERRRNLMVGGVAAAVLVLVGVVFYVVSQGNNVDATAAGQSDYGVTIGPDSAPHKVVVYEDFLCPFCGRLEAATHKQLATLADDGKVQVDYRPFTLLTRSDYSARATSAFGVVLDTSGPTVAKKFHDLLYADQPSETATTFPDAQWLIDKAVEAGADQGAVKAGIEAGENDFAREATQDAQVAGVTGTPTVLVDGKVLANADGQTLLDAVQ